ncbi:MAG: carbohydrate porin [Candidatus Omnitrophica bacterium]|nr:carbohydrate porin [Candidatus Omnitrophota bacterium]
MLRGHGKILFGIIVLVGLLAIAPRVQAEGEWILKDQRAKLQENGLSFKVVSLEDYVSVLSGGISHKDTWNGLLDFGINYDLGKAGFVPGGSIFFRGAEIHGGQLPSGDLVGDAQGVDDYEANHTFRVWEAGYKQSLMNDKLSLKAGILDLDSDLAFSDLASGLFLNSAFSLTPTITNNIDVSLYPITTLGVLAKFSFSDNFTLQAGVYDGSPIASEQNHHNLNIKLSKSGGLLSVVEGAYGYKLPVTSEGLAGTFKLGAWYDSKAFDDVVNVDENEDPVKHGGDFGGYFTLDQKIWCEKDDQGLSAFLIGGAAPKDRNAIERHLGAGLVYTGLIPSRDADQLGVAFTNAYFSHKAYMANGTQRSETTIETSYQWKVNDSLSFEPDFQYVYNPGGDASIKNASVFMLRTKITY